jgi:hypothetical protein
MKKLIYLFALLLFSSCATVFTGSKKWVTFDANIDQEATLTIDGYKLYNITFPYTTRIRGGFDETIVKAESEGYKTTQIIINKNFNAVSVINLCDPLGWAIDAATGAMMKPEYKFYEFDFKKVEPSNYVEQ